jgi:iron complex transport system substrate-binding protein
VTRSRRRLLCALALAPLAIRNARAQDFVDATGRTVRLPPRVTRVWPAGPPANVLLLAVAPDKMIGWTRAPRPDEAPFLPDDVASLPQLGRLTGRGATANLESVLRAKPDLIVDVGSTAPTFVSLARQVESQTGIPYVLLDGTLSQSPRLLREVGALTGSSDAAEALAGEADRILRDVAQRIAPIPESRRVRVYYARGANGLTTAPAGSLQAEALALAGGANVIPAPPGFNGNLVSVSPEDILAAQPDVIVAGEAPFAAEARTLPGWRDLPAIHDGRLYVPPNLPFGWFDAPPSVNRLLGVQWLAKLLYPDIFVEPLAPRVKDFHRRFYHREPTDAQVMALLARAGGVR